MSLYKAVITGAHPLGRWATHMFLSNDTLSSSAVYTQLINWVGAWWTGDGGSILGIGNRCATTVTYDLVTLYTLDPDTGRAVGRIAIPGTPVPGLSGTTCGPCASCGVVELRATQPTFRMGRLHTPPLTQTSYSSGNLATGNDTLIRNATQFAFAVFHTNLIIPRLVNLRTMEIASVEFFLVPKKVASLGRRTRSAVYTSITGSV